MTAASLLPAASRHDLWLADRANAWASLAGWTARVEAGSEGFRISRGAGSRVYLLEHGQRTDEDARSIWHGARNGLPDRSTTPLPAQVGIQDVLSALNVSHGDALIFPPVGDGMSGAGPIDAMSVGARSHYLEGSSGVTWLEDTVRVSHTRCWITQLRVQMHGAPAHQLIAGLTGAPRILPLPDWFRFNDTARLADYLHDLGHGPEFAQTIVFAVQPSDRNDTPWVFWIANGEGAVAASLADALGLASSDQALPGFDIRQRVDQIMAADHAH